MGLRTAHGRAQCYCHEKVWAGSNAYQLVFQTQQNVGSAISPSFMIGTIACPYVHRNSPANAEMAVGSEVKEPHNH